MAKRSKSSSRWLNRQKKDYFARQARVDGQVSRAHYKLEQIDQRYKLLRPGSAVLELGAAPGGWTRYIESRLTSRSGQGLLIAVDSRQITSGAETHVIEGLAGDPEVDAQIAAILDGSDGQENSRQLDLVLSDMAPNISGIRAVDQARAMDLAEVAAQACENWLKRGGDLVVKAFQGEGFDEWVAQMRTSFGKVEISKPKASRPDSREVFVVARKYS